MLSRALDIHAELENPQDREWIHILLAYLRTCTNDMSKELASEVDEKKSVTQLIRALHTAAASLDSGVYLPYANGNMESLIIGKL